MASTRKLVFDDQRSLQVLLGSPAEQQRIASELLRVAGVAMHVRGTEVTLEGELLEAVAVCESTLRQMYDLARAGKPVSPSDVGRAIEVLRSDAGAEIGDVFDDQLIARSVSGRGVTPRSLAQKRYVDAMRKHHLVFGVGPAGTGKTFLAVAMAVRRMLDKQIRRIILCRPALEAGENLGFLPGTFEEKISPYMRPLYDALFDMIEASKVQRMIEHGTIEVAPLAYMRGRTLSDAFVILDEAQNATREQMKMFLTRIGTGTWAVVTGDPSQVDLPNGQSSGLAHALHVLRDVSDIRTCRFTGKDVMRHTLVQDIVRAYDRDDQGRVKAREARQPRVKGEDGLPEPA